MVARNIGGGGLDAEIKGVRLRVGHRSAVS